MTRCDCEGCVKLEADLDRRVEDLVASIRSGGFDTDRAFSSIKAGMDLMLKTIEIEPPSPAMVLAMSSSLIGQCLLYRFMKEQDAVTARR